MKMLNLGKSKIYELLQNNTIRHVRIGKKYVVPKKAVIDIFSNLWYNDEQVINNRLQSVEEGVSA
jgi:excisionase family DNA binding protein